MKTEPPPTADYPVALHLSGRLVVIVGAGQVGKRKLRGVAPTGARIKIIDPAGTEIHPATRTDYLQREYRPGDLSGAELVFICTDDPVVNQQVADEAAALSIWYCRSDQPRRGSLTVPAVLRRENLTVAVSTGGGSPALAALFRDRIAEMVPDSWGKAVEIIAAVRRKWLTEQTEVKYNQEVLRKLLDQELVPLIAHKQIKKIDQLLLSQFGAGFTLSELRVKIDEGAP
jgi:precorrin-2 dehydrogenase/sirohydrochlorin ferrochelatase